MINRLDTACATGCATLLLLAMLAGCSSSPAPTDGPIVVAASDSTCELGRTEAPAGKITFEITNSGARPTEFYFYGAGNRVIAEAANIEPGKSRQLVVEVADGGKYTTACKPGLTGNGIRGAFTVAGTATRSADTNAKLATAVTSYKRYVASQTDALVARTRQFVAAVKAADIAKAKALYPVARIYWERIEPVAESFGDIDPKIDAREDIVAEGGKFTGYHRLEKDLWVDGLKPDTSAIADGLLADINELVTKTKTVELTPVQLANGAKELLDEVATGKITGEEDRYSHTDLWDFQSNVEGSQAAIAALRPVIDDKDAALGRSLDEQFAAVFALLQTHRVGDGFKLYTALNQAEIKALAAAVDALGEPVSKVAGVVTSP